MPKHKVVAGIRHGKSTTVFSAVPAGPGDGSRGHLRRPLTVDTSGKRLLTSARAHGSREDHQYRPPITVKWVTSPQMGQPSHRSGVALSSTKSDRDPSPGRLTCGRPS